VNASKPCVTLIPCCGIGHEAAYLSEAGWDVTAIDFSSGAVAAAQIDEMSSIIISQIFHQGQRI